MLLYAPLNAPIEVSDVEIKL